MIIMGIISDILLDGEHRTILYTSRCATTPRGKAAALDFDEVDCDATLREFCDCLLSSILFCHRAI